MSKYGFVLLSSLILFVATSSAASAKDDGAAPVLDVSARIHSLATFSDAEGEPASSFGVGLARLAFEWDLDDVFEAKLQVDVDQLVKKSKEKSLMRDAYVELKPFRWLHLKVGQFKRPFGRIELTSKAKLPVVDRGIANGFLIEDLVFGDRDLGIELSGRIGKKKLGLAYAVGVFNGTGKNAGEDDLDGTKDVVARLVARLGKPLSLGMSFSLKRFDTETHGYLPSWAYLVGLDAKLYFGDARVVVEGMMGDAYDQCIFAVDEELCQEALTSGEIPRTYAVDIIASYKVKVWNEGGWDIEVEPVVKGELFTPDSDIEDGSILSGSVGVNVHLNHWVRLMVHGELIKVGDQAPTAWQDELRLLVQAAFDI